MSDSSDQVTVFRMGVLDHARFAGQFLPIIERARGGRAAGVAAVEELKAFVANVKDRAQREEAQSQLERIEVSVSSNRWHAAAAGNVLQAALCDELKEIPDMLHQLPTWLDFLYDWDETNAEAIQRFFSFLSDHTLDWASPVDTWRAAVGPDDLEEVATAMGALTPRQLAKMLASVEDGDVFSEQEAEEIADWWNEIRTLIRLARRQEAGVLFVVSLEPRRAP